MISILINSRMNLGLCSQEQRLLRDRSGVAAIEFAIVAPLLILLYLAGVELTLALTCNQKVKHATAVVGDLIGQSTKLTVEEITEYFSAANAVVQPYSSKPIRIRVSVLSRNADGLSKVVWSASRGMSKRNSGSAYQTPSGLWSAGQKSLVVAETIYSYETITGSLAKASFELTEVAYVRPRGRAAIVCTNC